MIKMYELLPQVYNTKSRDFQILSTIYDVIFNYLKTGVDMIYNLPLSKNSDKKLLDLMASTLNFETSHAYDDSNLYALCNSFIDIMRHKGTKRAIEECVRVLMRSQNINEKFEIQIDSINYTISLLIPYQLNDIDLLEDMLEYVLPVGYLFEVIPYKYIETYATELVASDKLTSRLINHSINLSQVAKSGVDSTYEIEPSITQYVQVLGNANNVLGELKNEAQKKTKKRN